MPHLLGYAWAAPVTAVGLCLGLLAAVSGGRVRLRGGVLEVTGGLVGWLLRGNRLWQGGAAATLGHVILARDDASLERSRLHELVHVRQFERWGVFLLPTYQLIAWWLTWNGHDPHLDHPFEQEAYGHDRDTCLEWVCRQRRPTPPKEATVQVKVFNRQGHLVGPVEVAKVVKTDAEWSERLTPEQFQVARGKGTEQPFCGTLLDNKRQGVYACVCCGLPLFESGGKFNSGTGWPSFFRPVASENVSTHEDRSHGRDRTEILCTRCDAHLGHVFEDGPPPTGLRYCVNSESLVFTDEKDLSALADPAAPTP